MSTQGGVRGHLVILQMVLSTHGFWSGCSVLAPAVEAEQVDVNGWEWGTEKERQTICKQAGARTGPLHHRWQWSTRSSM